MPLRGFRPFRERIRIAETILLYNTIMDVKKTLVKFFKATRLGDILTTAGVLAAATLFCFLLQRFSSTDTHVPLLFVLAVLIISRYTHGYRYGFIASVLAVMGVNMVFTYPYFRLDFTLTGYPLTFAMMLAVSFIVCALTTRIKAQEEIQLEIEREKMRGNLLRAVSHDIRTPLTSIVGSASAILDNYNLLDDNQRKELTRDIRNEAQWLNRIVENILSITRMTDAAATISKNDELAEEIVSSAVAKFRKRNPGAHIEVSVPDEPLLVPMDPILIEQVLVNLLDNAVAHGGNVSMIRLRVGVDEGSAVFTVEDDGAGIRADVLPHLFDGTLPLSEEDSDARSNMKIGLSVCMSIVKAHRGDMYAENRKEGGARMSFRLPLND